MFFASHELLSVSSVAVYGFAREVDSNSHLNGCFQMLYWNIPKSDVRHFKQFRFRKLLLFVLLIVYQIRFSPLVSVL